MKIKSSIGIIKERFSDDSYVYIIVIDYNKHRETLVKLFYNIKTKAYSEYDIRCKDLHPDINYYIQKAITEQIKSTKESIKYIQNSIKEKENYIRILSGYKEQEFRTD